jgi:hypothetical protein
MAMDDAELWDLFQRAALPAAAWTHEAHLRIAWMHLRRHALDEAHLLMRVGIIRLNAFHALVETPSRGYHETITRTWLRLVAAAMRAPPAGQGPRQTTEADAADSRAFLAAHGDRLGKDAPMRHYSRERLLSVEARAVFVPPDVCALE